MDLNHMKNKALSDSEMVLGDSEVTSDSAALNRKLWITAQEAVALAGMPSTDRRARDLLSGWSAGKTGTRRKRIGSKATEYHISVLPPEIRKYIDPNDYHPEPVVTIEESVPAQYEPTFLDEFALIPGYRVQVSAGHGTLAPEYEAPVRHLAFRRKWLKWRGFNESDLAIVWCKGDSMEPTISDNNSLVVHTGRTRPVDGHIYVVRNDDQLWVKRVQVLPGAWLLISDNKHYRPITIHKDEQHAFQVIGQVVHISKDVGE